MELITSQDILVRGLHKVQGIVERKNTLPILSHFLLTAQGDETIIHATDLELGYKGYLDTTVNKPGTATLPARKTYDILRELPAGAQVKLTVESNGWASIEAAAARFKVPCLPAEEYPALPPVEDAEFSSLDGAILEEMIRQTIFATSHDETRYTLSGVLLICDGRELTMVATDGHRLAHTRRPVAFGRNLRVIVPRKALEEVGRFAADSEEKTIDVALLQNHLVFRKGRATLVTRLIEGQFPDYEGVIPRAFQRRATVEHERLMRALRRVSLLSNEKTKPVKVEFASDSLTLRSNTPEMGEATEEIPAEYQGEAMVMGFNARYLLEALAVTTEEQV
ncbi:MAG: DNA polymerase III subunit beta, partial [candidate division KSB1 bacterium]|nr:DNA polymerase III subunit beta [candidate division KSB1 bacterium]